MIQPFNIVLILLGLACVPSFSTVVTPPGCVGTVNLNADSREILTNLEKEYRLVLGESRFEKTALPPMPDRRLDLYTREAKASPRVENTPLENYDSMLQLVAQLIGFRSHGLWLMAPFYEDTMAWVSGKPQEHIPFPFQNVDVSLPPSWTLQRMTCIPRGGGTMEFLHEDTKIYAAQYDATYYDTSDRILDKARLTLRDRSYRTLDDRGAGDLLARKITLKSEIPASTFDHRRKEHSVAMPKDGDLDTALDRMHQLLRTHTGFQDQYSLLPIATMPNSRFALNIFVAEGGPKVPIATVMFDTYKVIMPDGRSTNWLNEIEFELMNSAENDAWMTSHKAEFEEFLKDLRAHIGGSSHWSQESKLSRGLKAQ